MRFCAPRDDRNASQEIFVLRLKHADAPPAQRFTLKIVPFDAQLLLTCKSVDSVDLLQHKLSIDELVKVSGNVIGKTPAKDRYRNVPILEDELSKKFCMRLVPSSVASSSASATTSKLQIGAEQHQPMNEFRRQRDEDGDDMRDNKLRDMRRGQPGAGFVSTAPLPGAFVPAPLGARDLDPNFGSYPNFRGGRPGGGGMLFGPDQFGDFGPGQPMPPSFPGQVPDARFDQISPPVPGLERRVGPPPLQPPARRGDVPPGFDDEHQLRSMFN